MPEEEFLATAVSIAERAETSNIPMRLLGAIAFQIHSQSHLYLFDKIGRKLTDFDFIGYSEQYNELIDFFTEAGYEFDLRHSHLHRDRLLFHNKETGKHLDVFLDKLEMCHTIDLRGRLHLDRPTITLADLLLEKMQIVQINEKDIIDTIILLSEHELSDGVKPETVDSSYISELLSQDWGFYYTVTTNLVKVKQEFLDHYHQIPEADRRIVNYRINELVEKIGREPKSVSWKMRARVGTRRKWYRDVEEIVR